MKRQFAQQRHGLEECSIDCILSISEGLNANEHQRLLEGRMAPVGLGGV